MSPSKKKKKKKLPFWCKVNKRCVFCLAIVMWIGQVICNLQTRDEFDKDRRVKTKLKIDGSMLHGLINGIWNFFFFWLCWTRHFEVQLTWYLQYKWNWTVNRFEILPKRPNVNIPNELSKLDEISECHQLAPIDL